MVFQKDGKADDEKITKIINELGDAFFKKEETTPPTAPKPAA